MTLVQLRGLPKAKYALRQSKSIEPVYRKKTRYTASSLPPLRAER